MALFKLIFLSTFSLFGPVSNFLSLAEVSAQVERKFLLRAARLECLWERYPSLSAKAMFLFDERSVSL